MKYFKLSALFVALLALVVVTSCGDDDDDDDQMDPRQETIDAITNGNWSLNVSSSTVPEGIDLSGVSGTISTSSISISGVDQVSSISFSIDDDGNLTDASVTVGNNELQVDGTPSASINGALNQITVTFSLAAAEGRVGGVGTWTLVFSAA